MLACARIGAIHSVVFGGFAAASLATRIDDAKPKVMVTSDAGMRGGKAVPYKHLVDEAIRLAQAPAGEGDHRQPRPRPGDGARRRAATSTTRRCARSTWTRRCPASGSSRASRRTSSTRRARPASRRACSATPAATRSRSPRRCASIFCVEPGETMFTTSDIGWVVGHSYIIYAPLINGSTTIMYEGLPIRPDPGDLVEDRRARTRSGRCSARRRRSAC